jgi:hypothetical protein
VIAPLAKALGGRPADRHPFARQSRHHPQGMAGRQSVHPHRPI